MNNILYKIIGERSGSIIDRIERYCIFENRNKADVFKLLFNFLKGDIKTQLDDQFVKVCLEQITNKSNDTTKKVLSHYSATTMRSMFSIKEGDYNIEKKLKQIEGGHGNITTFMRLMLDERKSDCDKIMDNLKMVDAAKNPLYIFLLIGLYSGEESSIEIKYANDINEIVIYKYTRHNYIEDLALIEPLCSTSKEESKTNDKEESIKAVLKFTIIKNEDEIAKVFNFLDRSKNEIIDCAKDRKSVAGAICLRFSEFDIFRKKKETFKKVFTLLFDYWGLPRPSYDKRSKYKQRLEELRSKYMFLDKGLE